MIMADGTLPALATNALAGPGGRQPRAIDRILVKSHGDVTLEPLNWEIPEEFQSPAGAPLSDHDPVAARVRWQLTR
jgi:endonuclease/exonuclease/phosphatase family metal-dependent hydrolase